MEKFAPITLFVYNRLQHTKKTVASLKANTFARKSLLIIYSDGPKDISDRKRVGEVRTFIHTVSGFKEVRIIEREKNYGLADSILNGVTSIVNRYGKIIVLEDDLVVSPIFLEYMNSALKKYEHQLNVMQISGFMYPVMIHTKQDALFLPFTESWGWATWKRAWNAFDAQINRYTYFDADKHLRWEFNINGVIDYAKMLDEYFKKKNNSWAVRWYAHVFFNRGIVLFPRISLVENQGFDNTGTHARLNSLYTQPLDKTFRVQRFPDSCMVTTRYAEISQELRKFFNSQRTITFKINDMAARIQRYFH